MFWLGLLLSIPVSAIFIIHGVVQLAVAIRKLWLRIEEYPGAASARPPVGNLIAGTVLGSAVLPFLLFALLSFPWLHHTLGSWNDPISQFFMWIALGTVTFASVLTLLYVLRVNLDD